MPSTHPLSVAPAATEIAHGLTRDDAERVGRFTAARDAMNTRRTYGAALRDWSAWATGRGVEEMPARPEHVAAWLAERAETLSPASIQVRASAIARAHRDAGLESPTDHPGVRRTLKGIRRAAAEDGHHERQARALSRDDVRAMVAALPVDSEDQAERMRALRDRAALVLGFLGAFRRAELASLAVEDVAHESQGLRVTLRRSKTDQAGEGAIKTLARGSDPLTCPVHALADWAEAAGVTTGPILRAVGRWGHVGAAAVDGRTVARIVQSAAQRARVPVELVSGHSLRAGFATAAAAAGAPERAIMVQTGHRSEKMVRRYVRHGSAWAEDATAAVRL